jgi:hypothetical protein
MTTTREGVDFSGTHPSADAMRQAGRDFVVRYVSTAGNPKNITATEAAYWRDHGIDVAIVFETAAGRALSGRTAGVTDAAAARTQVVAAGGPASGGVVYFAADVDTTSPAQRAAIADYLTGAASILGWAQVGIYGEYELLTYLAASIPCRYFWQTYAWSGGQRYQPAQLYQYSNGQTLGGVEVDYDRAYADDFGQWGFEGVDVAFSDDQARQLKAIYDQIVGAVGTGQHDFQGTIETTLGTVQHVVNLVNGSQTALSQSLTDMRSAVLASIAAVPTGHLTDDEREALAGEITTLLETHGITIDTAPLLDALATRIAA